MTDFSFAMLPGVDQEEILWLQELTKDYSEDSKRKFIALYQSRRKDPQTVLICCLLGLVCVSGIHRFILNQVGMGILYLFTGGLCLIGTIVDAVNHRKLAWEFNKVAAMEAASLLKMY
ncbi:TM2 domain-containing protein [Chitinophaga sancti]|uniref:TM2 domain-containing protein n=1 Tax=Chitinophaga sancti TaxID=1004 RepID=UPI002A751B66|nr:TM2 domain-containing protein [Chitinophaga sancti]WPQ64144.1 TM2 domain-containing protein [Chitinophaga sancti]